MKYTNILEEINPALYEECAHKGKVERIDYMTAYEGKPMAKYAFVYTPYDYDETKAYDILYLIHGGGENAEKYLYMGGEENPLKRAVDNMIDNKTINPILIVTPSQYPDNVITPGKGENVPFIETFHEEMCKDLMPAVEAKYHTFADFKVDEESLKAARDHRSTMGWSMGSRTTWFTFLHKIGYIRKFGMLAGALTTYQETINADWGDQTAKRIVEAVKEQGFDKKDYSVYNVGGTKDQTYFALCVQDACLRAYPEYFDFAGEEQNISYLMWEDGEHHTKWRLQYTINAIKQFHGFE